MDEAMRKILKLIDNKELAIYSEMLRKFFIEK